jgi:hypothetical protein
MARALVTSPPTTWLPSRQQVQAEAPEDPVEGRVGRVEQPPPGERAHGGRNNPGHEQHAAPFALSLGRDVVNEMGDHEADDHLEEHGGEGEQ